MELEVLILKMDGAVMCLSGTKEEEKTQRFAGRRASRTTGCDIVSVYYISFLSWKFTLSSSLVFKWGEKRGRASG